MRASDLQPGDVFLTSENTWRRVAAVVVGGSLFDLLIAAGEPVSAEDPNATLAAYFTGGVVSPLHGYSKPHRDSTPTRIASDAVLVATRHQGLQGSDLSRSSFVSGFIFEPFDLVDVQVVAAG